MLSAGRIYYDWVEEGQLRGGWLTADGENPFHAAIPPATVLQAGMEPPLPAPPQYTWQTIVDHGPVSNRIDLVVVGDGYTVDGLDIYSQHAQAVAENFFHLEPLRTYFSLFNVHRVDVISEESGVDNDPDQGIDRDTALDSHFYCSGTERLLCVNVFKATEAAGSAPEVEQILVLANSTKYGGAGYADSDLAVFSGGNSSSLEIGVHEFGHSFANLADEYDSGGPERYSGSEPPEPNVSTLTASEMETRERKWHRWLDDPLVDTFEGAKYSRRGIYRPTDDSIMRTLGKPFGPVNAEQVVINVYRSVRPIDDATPGGSYALGADFYVQPVRPLDHALDIQWNLDGVPLPGQTGSRLDSRFLDLPEGNYQLSVTVTDNTPWVRDPGARQNLLTETRHWQIVVPEPLATVVGRYVDYRGAWADDNPDRSPRSAPAVSCSADVDCQKEPLLPGQTASFRNYTSFVRGINGAVIDLADAPGMPSREDLQFRVSGREPGSWEEAPEPQRVASFADGGGEGIVRLHILWEDGAIMDRWLEITLLPGPRTGLHRPDVHYWGNAVGETGDDPKKTAVDQGDLSAVILNANDFLDPAPLSSPYDMNRDGQVDGTDVAIVRDHWKSADESLPLLTAPPLWRPPSGPQAPPEENGDGSPALVGAGPWQPDPEGAVPGDPGQKSALEPKWIDRLFACFWVP
jgi:hypothetical protein